MVCRERDSAKVPALARERPREVVRSGLTCFGRRPLYSGANSHWPCFRSPDSLHLPHPIQPLPPHPAHVLHVDPSHVGQGLPGG